MIRKIGLLLGVAALGALVTSCGGGNNPDPTPTPTDTSTATPTPTPSPAATFSLTADFATNGTNTGIIVAYFTPAAGGPETFNDGARVNGTSTIAFVASPDSATFSFPDLPDPVVFDAADFVSLSATERRYVAGDEALTLFLPFAEVLQVSYQIENQAFTRDTVDGSLRSERLAIFFNPVTTTDDITAALSYTGQARVEGGEPGTTATGVLSSPQATFTVTPGATEDRITGTITVIETAGTVQTQVATITIDAALSSAGGFSGTITDAANSLTGQYAGTVAGANRDELLIVFSAVDDDATDTDLTEFLGSFIGS